MKRLETSRLDMRAARAGRAGLPASFARVRAQSEVLAKGLSDADASVQSMDDASPAKWHLAHTSWFFETFVLAPHVPGYAVFDAAFNYLFNSYYETLDSRHPRPRRGLLTRPSLPTVLDYRHYVTEAVEKLLARGAPRTRGAPAGLEALVTLGIAHEEQHQELLLTDILHLFAQNPLRPAFCPSEPLLTDVKGPANLAWIEFGGTIASIGHAGDGFAFDCEGPRHDVLLQPFRLANRPATNADWIAFIEDGGYRDPLLWLSDGWDAVQREDWKTPLYWYLRDGTWWTMTLRGAQPVDPAAPACQLSYYEADAFATWCGKRLPTEYEWEYAAAGLATDGNFAGCSRLRPRPSTTEAGGGLQQMFGDVWEWTRSPFTPYPRFAPEAGAVGEYNGKFMCGQFVLRGGSCATPDGHIRRTTRNFFQPDKRWQFSGLRLAQDA